MGFFKNLFSDNNYVISIDRSSWIHISNIITNKFADGREHWFSELILVLESTIKEKQSSIHIVNRKLNRESENTIKAYQLYLYSELMANKKYIPPAEGEEFSDLLFAQVAGKDLENVLNIFKRYHEVANDRSTMLFRFSGDIAMYITESQAPLMESVLIGSTVPFLTIMSRLSIAESFSDYELIKELENSMRTLMQ